MNINKKHNSGGKMDLKTVLLFFIDKYVKYKEKLQQNCAF